MLNELNTKATAALMRGQILVRQPSPEEIEQQRAAAEAGDRQQPQTLPRREPEVKEAGPQMQTRYNYRATKASLPGEEAQRAAASAPQGEQQRPMPIKNNSPKIGRNDLCPCGSGKKYKNCHGKNM